MLIECPYCHARAQLPESKAGAKVRCGECSRVYVAREPGVRGGGSGSRTGLILGIGAAVVTVVGLLVLRASSDDETVAQAPKPAPAEPAAAPVTGWRSAPVQAAVGLHAAAYANDEGRVRLGLHAARLWELGRAAGADPSGVTSFGQLARDEREAVLDAAVEELLRGASKEVVADWEPFDGEIVEESDGECVVHVDVRGRAAELATANRVVVWRLAKEAERWKAYAWERVVRPGEVKPERRARGFEKVTLSDGSIVLERDPEPLAHLADTAPELAARIDSLYATLIDLDLTREAAKAKRELVAIGKPALPILLTGLYQIPLDTEDQAKQVNQIVQALGEITGQDFGFKPMVLVGSGVGTTEERRQSAIRQWFAWWYRKGSKFEEKQTTDALEGLIELTEKEKAWLERNKAPERSKP